MNVPAKMDTKDFTLSLGLVLCRYLCGSESMHYGYWSDGLEVSIPNLGRAQKKFTEFILSHIPEGVKRICDVGSGSGELAQALDQRGYIVDCVSPGAYQAESVRGKLNGTSTVYPCKFEQLKTDTKYDLVIFSESFHYIKLEEIFKKLPGLLAPDGRVLICNFFKKDTPGKCAVRGGHFHAKYLKQMESSGFTCEKDIDITRETSPNMDLLGSAYQQVGAPVRDLFLRYVQANYPLLTRMVTPVMNRFYRTKLKKFNRKLEPGLVNAKHFEEHKTYRLNILRRSPSPGVGLESRPSPG